MGATIKEVESCLASLEMKHRREQEMIVMSFGTEHFTDLDPETARGHVLLTWIVVQENGGVLEIVAPKILLAEGEHREAVLAACMSLSWNMNFVKFSLDTNDNEIRASICVSLLEVTLTPSMLRRALVNLVENVDLAFPSLVLARDTGVLQLPSCPLPPDLKALSGVLSGLSSEQLAALRRLSPLQLAALKNGLAGDSSVEVVL
jgi:hypothetical protein